MSTSRILLVVLLAASSASLAQADPTCPATIIDAAKQAFPSAALTRCVAERAGFEVEMRRQDRSIVELEISARGEIQLIEEAVPVAAIPAAVTKAFTARYPRATIRKAEKLTRADKRVSFELAFEVAKVRREATFKVDGTFVEEE
jgi:biopolymer transport protein ExbD